MPVDVPIMHFNPKNPAANPVRVMFNGRLRWWHELTESEKNQWREEQGSTEGGVLSPERAENASRLQESREELGLPSGGDDGNPTQSDLLRALEQANIDTDNQQVAGWLSATGAALEAGDLTFDAALSDIQLMSLNPELQATTPYLEALKAAGFDGPYDPRPTPGQAQLAKLEGTQPQQIFGKPDPFEESEIGWIQYQNGVLVGPDDEVIIDPTSNAPGGAKWLRGMSNWSEEKLAEQKKMLVDLGYLTKDQAKVKGVSVDFREAIKAYHYNRYINGGTPVVAGPAGGGAGGADAPKPIDLEEFGAQIRNDVREQYERIYGVRPGDGEVKLWTDYIINQGMAMQRRNIRKYDSPMTDTAASEAEESFIEKLENTPQARLLRDSEQENTRMRDTLMRMAQVTDSLVT